MGIEWNLKYEITFQSGPRALYNSTAFGKRFNFRMKKQ